MSRVKNLYRDYGDFQVEIPEWVIADQGITALWGPSGSGKTSIFRLLIGVEPCPGMSWKFGEVDLAQIPVPQRELGVVFQTLELFPHMSARQNILFAAEARKVNDPKRFQQIVTELKLENCLERKAAKLSGGEAQRVALARAVIARPRFLFLDEPFSSLDQALRREARELVNRVIRKMQTPTLLITHDESDLEALADFKVEVANGKIVGGSLSQGELPK